MNDLYIAAGNETPEVNFAYSQNQLSISGESYPENAMAFYGPLRAGLQNYLDALAPGARTEVNIALRYFNSSSTKLIRALVSLLDSAAANGKKVVLNWLHDEDDDMMREFGQDLMEEHEALELRLVAAAAA